ncbi:MAG TPA: cyclase family protein [Actinomycetes bacterium]|nr:cyclase family protein [Actinomycetes bacterium]
MWVVDLSAELSPATVMWPGDEPMSATNVEEIDPDGSFCRRVSLSEHSGTHFDAPRHCVPGGETVAEISAAKLFRPLRVLDISARAATDSDAELAIDDVERHETNHGRISDGSAVFLHTGWGRLRNDAATYAGSDDRLAFPGYGLEAARLLVEQRHVAGIGIDTLSVDAGYTHGFPIHSTVTLPKGVWHVENAINLDQVPATGAWVVVGVPRVAGASGFPARVLALVPGDG